VYPRNNRTAKVHILFDLLTSPPIANPNNYRFLTDFKLFNNPRTQGCGDFTFMEVEESLPWGVSFQSPNICHFLPDLTK
jgi:hypothetical protein